MLPTYETFVFLNRDVFSFCSRAGMNLNRISVRGFQGHFLWITLSIIIIAAQTIICVASHI
ncbi:hypothetical protein B598_0847 [Chlamydia psittaci GR9]|uniref:Uncharacterized protein n=1 Tax=Chlamydophila parapsittaci TaxID=344886 RepID=A0ABX5VWQ5_9CHLA|nr:hypothetical protein B598_0847 [Chlamydia psittaci GR9]AFS23728.1 hypothetical protein B601_0849 [Chlamydia psittaci WS/RT/E30]EPJ33166.1 hypothetical protein CP061683_1240 [Chlamydia psittaci 06-1683]EPP28371.1 hypothetical protein CP082626L3_1079 [Chlamydia psittaci 08-2626_L3]EPP31243.1 hypothetical protein CPC197_0987 [Chlamydia psittaci C1/97]QDE37003.1 hypothetical protein FI836_01565 [Chlamydophila parapsittaci]QHE18662.1 hypothetical protein GR632_01560 [Chlamydia psittaci]